MHATILTIVSYSGNGPDHKLIVSDAIVPQCAILKHVSVPVQPSLVCQPYCSCQGERAAGGEVSPPCCGAQSPVLEEAHCCLGLYEVAKLTHHFDVLQQHTHTHVLI